MAEESVVVMDRTPVGGRDLADAERPRLGAQALTQVDGPRRRQVASESERFQDFRTYFITVTANAYATMHYRVRWIDPRVGGQEFEAALDHPGTRPPPAGMEQRAGPGSRGDQIHRDAIRHRDEEHDAG